MSESDPLTPASAALPNEAQPDDNATAQTSSAPGDSRDAWLELALRELQSQRQQLQDEIRQLEARREQLQREQTASFSGQSDQIARRLKGFQDYMVGALQDLVVAAEQIELVPQKVLVQPSPLDHAAASAAAAAAEASAAPPAAAGLFAADAELIRTRLAAFQGQPDFYADPWNLRRSLEPAAAALLDEWFLGQGGRGAQNSSGSRSRNALMAAAAIAILGELYGDRFQTLVLAGEPERLGEWRRGLQDCLGLAREDFGPSSGIVLFERADALIERADRLEERGELPFIVIDAGVSAVEIPVLQFPLWLAFAAAPGELIDELPPY
ncbi:MAG: DUF3086 domain-containing protein [Cyanobacteriota bacterium]|nr:DUF3086 domain-containing protein [Cyanobacteriota bacterium]